MAAVSLLRLPDVLARTGLKKTTFYALIKNGKFPPPLALTERTRAWSSVEVQGWIDARISSARGGAK